MIPRVIHYCWLSNEQMPKEIEECMKSWKQNLPDFRLKKWDMSNFKVDSVPYVAEAVKARKWAFASDYIRLYALYTEGGIYFDTDVYVLHHFDEYLSHQFFSAIESYPGRTDIQIQSAVIGSEKEHPFVKDCMDYYNGINFVNSDNSFNDVIAPVIYAKIAEKYGFQYINKPQHLRNDIMLYSRNEITPLPDLATKKSLIVHCCAGSWRYVPTSRLDSMIHSIKNILVHILVIFGFKKTWNWKKEFKNFKSSI